MDSIFSRFTRCSLAFLILLMLFPVRSWALESDNGAKLLAGTKRDPEAAAKLAERERNPMVAGAAFGAFMRDSDSLVNEKALRTISKVGSKKGMFFQVAMMIAVNKQGVEIVEKLAVSKNTEDRRLAAATMSIIALGDRLAAEMTEYMASLPVEEDGDDLGDAGTWTIEEMVAYGADAEEDKDAIKKRKQEERKKKREEMRKKKGNRKKGGKKKGGNKKGPKHGSGRAIVSPSYEVLKLLLKDKDKLTVTYAMLAAAQSGDAGIKEAVDAVQPFDDVTYGAKLLYAARAGNATDDLFKQVLKEVGKIRKPVKSPGPEQSNGDTIVPGACLACQAIAVTNDKKYLPFLHKALFAPDYRIQVDAARAIKAIGSPDSLKPLWKRLPNCEWPVLIEVCNCLATITDKQSIPLLLKAAGTEKDRVLQNIHYALAANTGFVPNNEIKSWDEWWKLNKDTFGPDDKAKAEMERLATQKRPCDFYGIAYGWFYQVPIYSRNFCYVVDTSASMNGERIENLVENFTTSVEGLAKQCQTNIIDFGGDVVILNERGLFDNKRKMTQRIKTMPLTTGTRSYDAMCRAFRIPNVDAIYFLSDGAPVWGEIQVWNKIMWAFNVLRKYRPISVNAVDFFPSKSAQGSMERLYRENDGLGCSVQ